MAERSNDARPLVKREESQVGEEVQGLGGLNS